MAQPGPIPDGCEHPWPSLELDDTVKSSSRLVAHFKAVGEDEQVCDEYRLAAMAIYVQHPASRIRRLAISMVGDFDDHDRMDKKTRSVIAMILVAAATSDSEPENRVAALRMIGIRNLHLYSELTPYLFDAAERVSTREDADPREQQSLRRLLGEEDEPGGA